MRTMRLVNIGYLYLNEIKNRGVEDVLIFAIYKIICVKSLEWIINFLAQRLSFEYKYPETIKKLVYATNQIESLNSTIKRKTKSKGSFPTIDSAFKLMYLPI